MSKDEYAAAAEARRKAKYLEREQSHKSISAMAKSGELFSTPTFRTDPVTVRDRANPFGKANAARKIKFQDDLRTAEAARCSDDINDLPTPVREARRRETNDWLGQWQYEPAEMRKAMDKKLAANHAKYTEDMQFTQTGEPINPEFVLNAERHQIVNEKQKKQAPEPERRTPKTQKWFARAWRWLTEGQGEGIKPMSVHEMQQLNRGDK